MNAPLLTTKLHLPVVPTRYVARPRLLDRLRATLQAGQRLTVVTAPAGYGKTALLAAWLNAELSQRDSLGVAWLALDESDNDVVRFWRALIASLRLATVRPDFAAEALGMLQAPGPAPVESLVAVVLNELVEAPTPLLIAFDDYHLLQTAAIHGSLSVLIERLPPTVHVVMATRAEPPLGLARLRVRGQLIELGPADLRFTADETAAFLKGWLGDVAAVDMARLESRTEGWAAGLQLAALALQAAGTLAEREAFVKAFAGSQRQVLDYLVEEVLQHQRPEIQDFLLRTSILRRWCAEAAAALLPPPTNTVEQATPIIEQLDRASLFLIPLDAERRWFRYHHLFAEALRSRLAQAGPERLAELHRLAAGWFEGAALPDLAIDHALAARDNDRALRLIRAQARPLMIRGELSTWLNWVNALPAVIRDADPWLTAERGMAVLFAGRVEEAAALALQCESLLGTLPEAEARHVRGVVATMRAYAADVSGAFTDSLSQADQADALLPPHDGLARSVLPFVRGRAHLATGDLARAEEAFAAMVQMAQRIGNVWTLAVAVGQMTFATRLRGRLRVTDDAVAQALRVVHERSEESYGPAGLLESNQAGLVYERNDLAGAHELLVHALALLRGWGNPTALTSALWSMARVQLAQGDLAGAEQTLAEADAIVARTPVPAYTRAALAAERVRIWLAQGRLDEATRWADTIDLGDARSPAREPLGLALARGRLATGRATEAAQVLEGLARDARVAGRFGPLLEVLILNAVALADHSRPAALDRLEEALRLGAPEGYVRTFVNEGEPLRRLLGELIPRWERRRADPTHTPVTYATGLLSAMAAPTVPPEGQPGPVRPVEPLVEPLSARELEVLALVQAGLSNREIAERLVVTVATVKKHLENIHGKLGVHSRTQALARARALGLI